MAFSLTPDAWFTLDEIADQWARGGSPWDPPCFHSMGRRVGIGSGEVLGWAFGTSMCVSRVQQALSESEAIAVSIREIAPSTTAELRS